MSRVKFGFPSALTRKDALMRRFGNLVCRETNLFFVLSLNTHGWKGILSQLCMCILIQYNYTIIAKK